MSAANAQQAFFYRAMTPAGATRLGFKSAASEVELTESLGRDDLLLLRSWRIPLLGGTPGAPPKPPVRDEVALNEQIASLLDRGVTLTEAIEVAASVVSPASKPRLGKLRELVSAGDSFANACEKVGGFDTVTIAVYRAAERSGELAPAARRLADAARRKQAMATKAVTVMIYPAIVVTVSVLMLGGLLVFLVPQIASQVDELGGEIPAFSQAVFDVGTWLRAHLMATLIGFAGVIVVGMLLRAGVVDLLLAALRRVGAVARLLRAIELTRLFAVLAAMTRSGVPLSEALALSVDVISDPKLRDQLEWLQRSLVEGGVLRRLLEDVDALPLATRRLLIAAERGGDLDHAFDQLSADLAEDVDVRASRLLAMLEPLVILGMFAILTPLLLAIAIPLMNARIG